MTTYEVITKKEHTATFTIVSRQDDTVVIQWDNGDKETVYISAIENAIAKGDVRIT